MKVTPYQAIYQRDFENALLALLVERPDLNGEDLLATIIDEQGFALARLQEKGMIGVDEDD